ncbi:PadR family transcriptional regulator [Psychromicrobium lacuslunae]|uniref:PadR family transcriptional regulator n=1 Tax=Psychromicrobium lacuslunae TaxID=1618207 RepID=UPI000696D4FC|nr:PadR family transcriptional regulator [Psychromicrobium lacuslunae]
MTDQAPLTPTAWAIMGFLSLAPQSGYDILRQAKESIAEFWGISPGQLYPQLQALSARGYIRPIGEAQGPHARQHWEITEQGRDALLDWLKAPSAPLRVRDERLAKLFFGSRAEDPGVRDQAIAALQEERRRLLAHIDSALGVLLPDQELPPPSEAAKLGAPELAVRYGAHAARTAEHWVRRVVGRKL